MNDATGQVGRSAFRGTRLRNRDASVIKRVRTWSIVKHDLPQISSLYGNQANESLVFSLRAGERFPPLNRTNERDIWAFNYS